MGTRVIALYNIEPCIYVTLELEKPCANTCQVSFPLYLQQKMPGALWVHQRLVW